MTGKRKIGILVAAIAMGIFCFLGLEISSASAQLDVSVTVRLGDEYFVFREPDVAYAGDLDKEIGKSGIFDAKGRLKGFKKQIERKYCLEGIDEKLAAINALVFVEAKNAEVAFNPASPKSSAVTPDVDGISLDLGTLKAQISETLLAGKSFYAEVSPKPYKAEITAKDVKESLQPCISFSTDISNSTQNRKSNVRLALSKFNGKTFRRGETGSFNETVGPRTVANGFLEAKIIKDGEFVEGIGGGVCQASTTLYNALLLSGNKITEKHRHSLRVSYVPPSFDAMVSSAADMKFECTKKLLHIVTKCDAKRAAVEIYAKPDPVSITRKSIVLSEGKPPAEEVIVDKEKKYIDKVRFTDEKFVLSPSKGELRSEGWLIYSDGRREKVRSDVYKSQKGKIVTGAETRKPVPEDIE